MSHPVAPPYLKTSSFLKGDFYDPAKPQVSFLIIFSLLAGMFLLGMTTAFGTGAILGVTTGALLSNGSSYHSSSEWETPSLPEGIKAQPETKPGSPHRQGEERKGKNSDGPSRTNESMKQ